MRDAERTVPDFRIPIFDSDPLLNNAEAEWFREQFEKLAASNGFPRMEKRRQKSDDITEREVQAVR